MTDQFIDFVAAERRLRQLPPRRVITLELRDQGGPWTVREGDRFCPSLCWDEMLGTVCELTHPALAGKTRYGMRTEAEEDERNAQMSARGNRARQHTPPLALPAPEPISFT